MANDTQHQSNVVKAVLGGSWGSMNYHANDGGGGVAPTTTGPFANYKDYHDHKEDTWSKSGDHNSFTIHGLTHRDWKEK